MESPTNSPSWSQRSGLRRRHHRLSRQPTGYRHVGIPGPLPAPHHHIQSAQTERPELAKGLLMPTYFYLFKDTLTVEADKEKPGTHLVSFLYNASSPGRITLKYFAELGDGGCLRSTPNSSMFVPITVPFERGFRQKFQQPGRTGIDIACLREGELSENGDIDVYHLTIKLEYNQGGSVACEVNQVVFEKRRGEYEARVAMKLFWLKDAWFRILDVYGFQPHVTNVRELCVLCVSELKDTVAVPCRHMEMCSGCAEIVRFQSNKCPFCNQTVEAYFEIPFASVDQKVGEGTDEPRNLPLIMIPFKK